MSSWKIKHVLPLEVKHICPLKDSLAFSGEESLLIWNRMDNALSWRLNLKRQNVFANREAVYAGEKLIASFLADEAEDLAWIFALEPQSGRLAWKTEVPSSALMGRNRTDNYIAATSECIFYTDRKEGQAWLRDARSGNVKAEFPGFNIDALDSNPRYIALYEWHSGELRLLDAESSTPEFNTHALGQWLQGIKLSETQLTALVIDGEGDFRQLKIKQFLLPNMELQHEYTFPEFLEDSRLLDVESSNHILIEDRDLVHCIDLPTMKKRWSLESDLPSLMRTPQGLLVLPSFGTPELRNLDTGEVIQELSDDGFQPPFLKGEGEILCLGPWDEIESLQNPDVSERTVWLEWMGEQGEIDEPEPLIEFAIMEHLKVSGPRKEQLKTQLRDALRALDKEAKWSKFFDALKAVFEVEEVHVEVKAFLQSLHQSGTLAGAIGVGPFNRVLTACTYQEFWSMGPDNALFPALLIASEPGGHYFYVHLQSGELICVHHDDNYDFASNWEELLESNSSSEFAKAMFANPLFDLKEWLAYNAGFGGLDQDELRDLEEEEPEEFFRLLQKATGWTFEKLYEKMWDNELSVLTYSDENYELLKELGEG